MRISSKVPQIYFYTVMESHLVMQNIAFWNDFYPQNLESEAGMLHCL